MDGKHVADINTKTARVIATRNLVVDYPERWKEMHNYRNIKDVLLLLELERLIVLDRS